MTAMSRSLACAIPMGPRKPAKSIVEAAGTEPAIRLWHEDHEILLRNDAERVGERDQDSGGRGPRSSGRAPEAVGGGESDLPPQPGAIDEDLCHPPEMVGGTGES